MSKRALCLLFKGFEEIETVTPIDLLRRAGVEVVVASLEQDDLVTGRSNITLQADNKLSAIDVSDFDLLIIPGGIGVKAVRLAGQATQLARQFFQAEKFVSAICAAPLILLDAGLLDGRKYTAHFSTQAELPQAVASKKVVIDDRLITSQGAGTAVEFGLALVAQLLGESASAQVAKAIMA